MLLPSWFASDEHYPVAQTGITTLIVLAPHTRQPLAELND